MKNTNTNKSLINNANKMGIDISESELSLFIKYTNHLLYATESVNLTAFRKFDDIISKIHLDSLGILPPIANYYGLSISNLRNKTLNAIDVGAGAGVPGFPIRFVWHKLKLVLVDSNHKKTDFMKQVVEQLQLDRVDVISMRSEDLGHSANYRESFALVFARAVAPLPTLLELTLPFAKQGGLVVLPKGPKAPDEVNSASNALSRLGGELISLADLQIPGVIEKRKLILIQKTRPTPPEYPRKPGIPKKKPL